MCGLWSDGVPTWLGEMNATNYNIFLDLSYNAIGMPREMENLSRGPTFFDFVTIRTDASMQDITVARLKSIQE